MPAQILLAAINREQLATASRIAAARGMVVFGTMDGGLLKKIETGGTVVPVYFYEPG
ncbi:hypothetical protein [Desulfallas thermosapovorans]|uniref:Uncharacterized protein n=1 Tax=Desulfallas thermosapovorans DSM 6562 TaxID=1121431 RepID=A0A5S4ZN22_9FIRM|nr:hypothetical protein [Desulfallas thermosapovorans]TYO93340.1 hypothetical protein LX24_02666 [Desulfallas thermosapovorans DSM 6562]